MRTAALFVLAFVACYFPMTTMCDTKWHLAPGNYMGQLQVIQGGQSSTSLRLAVNKDGTFTGTKSDTGGQGTITGKITEGGGVSADIQSASGASRLTANVRFGSDKMSGMASETGAVTESGFLTIARVGN